MCAVRHAAASVWHLLRISASTITEQSCSLLDQHMLHISIRALLWLIKHLQRRLMHQRTAPQIRHNLCSRSATAGVLLSAAAAAYPTSLRRSGLSRRAKRHPSLLG